jgi:hypothetical protein
VAWSVSQLTVLERFSGALSVPELVAELALHGDPHNERAVVQQALVSGISLRRRRRSHPWTEEEDALIGREAGRRTAAEIATLLRLACQYPRSAKSVRRRGADLGVSFAVAVAALDLAAVCAILSVRKATVRSWVLGGLLRAERRSSGVSGGRWRFLPADLEAFLDAYPVLVDWRAVQGDRWRQIARRSAVRSSWLGVEQAADVLKLAPRTVRTQVQAGRYAGAIKIGKVWRIPASALPAARLAS